MLRVLAFILLGIVIIIAFLSGGIAFLLIGNKRAYQRTGGFIMRKAEPIEIFIDNQTKRRKS
jgi:flagellar basal body-associated protein FliL